ncbi:MAG: corrinoid protein [Chloroflexota bacterium]
MANKAKILESLAKSVETGNISQAETSAKDAVAASMDALEAINEGLVKGMGVVGDRYNIRQIYLPQVLMAAEAMYAGLDVLTPHIKVDSAHAPKKVVIGTVEGDTHDIGKNIVKAMLTAAGFTTYDLGNDVPVSSFIEKAKEVNADFVYMSTLMTPTMDAMKRVIDGLKEEGLRAKVKVGVGGAPISRTFADDIGADLYALNAHEATERTKALAAA